MPKVCVGSTNPIKIRAVQVAFEKVWPEKKWEVLGISAPSGVASQPLSDDDSLQGANNRAKWLLKHTDADFVAGIEGGINQIGTDWFGCGWAVVIRRSDGVKGVGSSARVQIPESMMKLLLEGMELGEVVDQVFGRQNAKQHEGHFGLMTNGLITRQDGYVDGIIFALSRFTHSELF